MFQAVGGTRIHSLSIGSPLTELEGGGVPAVEGAEVRGLSIRWRIVEFGGAGFRISRALKSAAC